MEELLLDEAEHSRGVLGRAVQNFFDLRLHDLVGDDTQLQTQRHCCQNRQVVADERDECPPKEHVLPDIGDLAVDEDAAVGELDGTQNIELVKAVPAVALADLVAR